MDSKTIFVRTGKGENEAHSKTSHLSGNIVRALLMVDGAASFGEIFKRAAPSLRNTLDEMFVELEREGFIQNISGPVNVPQTIAPELDKAKAANIPRMVVPDKMAVPRIVIPTKKLADEGFDELDFTAPRKVPTAHVLAVEAETEKIRMASVTKVLAEAEAKARAFAAEAHLFGRV